MGSIRQTDGPVLQIEAGLKSRTQALAERGYDAEQVDREIAAERKRELALGLDFRRPGSPAQGPDESGKTDEDPIAEKDDEADDTGDEKSDPKEGA